MIIHHLLRTPLRSFWFQGSAVRAVGYIVLVNGPETQREEIG
jgi:hypothetical protein